MVVLCETINIQVYSTYQCIAQCASICTSSLWMTPCLWYYIFFVYGLRRVARVLGVEHSGSVALAFLTEQQNFKKEHRAVSVL